MLLRRLIAISVAAAIAACNPPVAVAQQAGAAPQFKKGDLVIVDFGGESVGEVKRILDGWYDVKITTNGPRYGSSQGLSHETT